MCDNYIGCLEKKLVDLSSTIECTAEECWNQLRSCIASSAEEYIGRGYHSNPELFEDNVEILKSLINNKNEALQKWMQSDTRSCKHFFCQCQWAVQKAVIKVKEEWIQKVASDAEAAVKDCKIRWNNIHRLQQVYHGRRPTAVFKDNGELTKGPSEVSDHWIQHPKYSEQYIM